MSLTAQRQPLLLVVPQNQMPQLHRPQRQIGGIRVRRDTRHELRITLRDSIDGNIINKAILVLNGHVGEPMDTGE